MVSDALVSGIASGANPTAQAFQAKMQQLQAQTDQDLAQQKSQLDIQNAKDQVTHQVMQYAADGHVDEAKYLAGQHGIQLPDQIYTNGTLAKGLALAGSIYPDDPQAAQKFTAAYMAAPGSDPIARMNAGTAAAGVPVDKKQMNAIELEKIKGGYQVQAANAPWKSINANTRAAIANVQWGISPSIGAPVPVPSSGLTSSPAPATPAATDASVGMATQGGTTAGAPVTPAVSAATGGIQPAPPADTTKAAPGMSPSPVTAQPLPGAANLGVAGGSPAPIVPGGLMGQKMAETQRHNKAMEGADQASLAPPLDENGTPLTGAALRAAPKSPATDMAIANEALADGSVKMPYLRTPLAKTTWASTVADMKRVNPDANVNQAAENLYFQTGKGGDKIRSFNVAIAHLNTLSSLTDALQNGDIQAFNKIGNAWANQTGNPAPGNFNAAKQIVGDEIVKAIVGSGGTGGDRDKAQADIDAAKSPAQLAGVIQTYKTLMAGQLAGIKGQYEGTGQKNFNNHLSPDAQSELENIHPSAPQPGAQAAPVSPVPTIDIGKLKQAGYSDNDIQQYLKLKSGQ